MFKPTTLSRGLFGALLGTALLGSVVPNAHALAAREHNTSLNSYNKCVERFGHLTYFGSHMAMSAGRDTNSTWCIHEVADLQNTTIRHVGNAFSYPRDNLRMFIPIGTVMTRVRVNIPGGGRDGVDAPMRHMGTEFIHNLRPARINGQEVRDNGQVVWSIVPNDEVGLKIWSQSSCGDDPISAVRQSIHAMNTNPYHSNFADGTGGNTPGVAFAAAGRGCNFFGNIVTELVLLKPDVVNGRIDIPGGKLATLKLHSGNFRTLAGHIDFDINLAPMSFVFQPRTCSYSGPKDQTVIMKKVSVQDFFGIRDGNRVRRNPRQEVYSYNDSGKAIGNDTIEGNQFSLILNCSRNANVESYVTFTDNLNPNNTTNILSPKTGTGQAQQVGIKLYLKGREEAINFSPIAFQPGTEGTKGQAIAQSDNAIRVGGRSNQAQTHRLDFTAKYARLGNRVTAGKVNAEMVFNFSYY